ncbi:helix-turn-helix transcriptional regulator [Allorhizobium sp. BGMRC 0089]|uniref:S24 family peptidase n=1 Tax=Allorhizobium sonneratiae TaxID=2934936 RepID=UPI002033EBA8|nr:helix-turn-helix transcriptional regulator [Allorhizobium sonneratiae]MCM2291461.1 helix-turn-helix transcriptional regulator [Allorhizobium sonneratiae]
MFSHETIWSAIDRLAEQHHLTPSGLARRAGLDPTAFNKSKRVGPDGRMRWPSTESIAKVLEATGASIDQFVSLIGYGMTGQSLPEGDFPPQMTGIPLLGFNEAGAGGFFDHGGFPSGSGWDLVDFPAAPGTRAGLYALEVQGDHMRPLYRDGDILIVDPSAELRRGDRVVVKPVDGAIITRVLGRQTARSIELLSFNPEHPARTCESSTIAWMARIIWVSQ